MAVDTNETRLATRYESIRRREYELITKLLEVLPKIDSLGDDHVVQVRDALFHADHPFLMVFVGPFSSGKSSLINALLGEGELLTVGPVPTTDRISILRYGDEEQKMDSGGEANTVFFPSPLLQKVSFVDTPGLESIFQKHEETTNRFLHRSDVVFLVMLATQAMTSRNLDYLRQLRSYGKKVIVVINQADLISEEEAETVRSYVIDQGRELLGAKPDVWLVSAKKGLQARKIQREANGADASTASFEQLWRESGMHLFEDYIDQQLDDVQRLRQKLQTPLQIAQSVHRVALDAVKANQSALDHYQAISDNVQQQLDAYRREQEKIVRDLNEEVSVKFGMASMRGGEAIQEIFQLNQALASVRRGLGELTGIGRLFRRGASGTHVRTVFEKHKVYEPIGQLPDISDKLGPRLEGKDLQDIDDLVKYAQREVNNLPDDIGDKVIGNIQAPMKYDRSILKDLRSDLERIEDRARVDETAQIDRSMRNALFVLAAWELIMIFALAVVAFGGALEGGTLTPIIIIVIIIALMLLGLLTLPLVGRSLENAHTGRMLKLQEEYISTLTKAADKQIEYGMRLRRETVAPLTRLVEAQTNIQTSQLNQLQVIDQEMISIESELSKMGKRNLLGIRG